MCHHILPGEKNQFVKCGLNFSEGQVVGRDHMNFVSLFYLVKPLEERIGV